MAVPPTHAAKSEAATRVFHCLLRAFKGGIVSRSPDTFSELREVFGGVASSLSGDRLKDDILQILAVVKRAFFDDAPAGCLNEFLLLTWLSLRAEQIATNAQKKKSKKKGRALSALIADTRRGFSGENLNAVHRLNFSDSARQVIFSNKALADSLLDLIAERCASYGKTSEHLSIFGHKKVTATMVKYEAFLQLISLSLYTAMREQAGSSDRVAPERSRVVELWACFLRLIRLLDHAGRREVVEVLLPAAFLRTDLLPSKILLRLAQLCNGETCVLAFACFNSSPGETPNEFFRDFLDHVVPRGKSILVEEAAAWWTAVAMINEPRILAEISQSLRNDHTVHRVHEAMPKVLADVRTRHAFLNRRLYTLEGLYITSMMADSTVMDPEHLAGLKGDVCTPELLENLCQRMPAYIRDHPKSSDENVMLMLDRFCSAGSSPGELLDTPEAAFPALEPFLVWLGKVNITRYAIPASASVIAQRLCSLFRCPRYNTRFSKTPRAHAVQLNIVAGSLAQQARDWFCLLHHFLFRSMAAIEPEKWRRKCEYPELYSLLMEALAQVAVDSAFSAFRASGLCDKLVACVPPGATFVPLFFSNAFKRAAWVIAQNGIKLEQVPQVAKLYALISSFPAVTGAPSPSFVQADPKLPSAPLKSSQQEARATSQQEEREKSEQEARDKARERAESAPADCEKPKTAAEPQSAADEAAKELAATSIAPQHSPSPQPPAIAPPAIAVAAAAAAAAATEVDTPKISGTPQLPIDAWVQAASDFRVVEKARKETSDKGPCCSCEIWHSALEKAISETERREDAVRAATESLADPNAKVKAERHRIRSAKKRIAKLEQSLEQQRAVLREAEAKVVSFKTQNVQLEHQLASASSALKLAAEQLSQTRSAHEAATARKAWFEALVRKRDLSAFGTTDVGELLLELGLGAHRSKFEDEEIDGVALEALDGTTMQELGVVNIVERKRLMHAVQLISRVGAVSLTIEALLKAPEAREDLAVATWNIQKLSQWLQQRGVSDSTCTILAFSGVNGEVFLNLQQADLREICPDLKAGERVKISKIADILRERFYRAVHVLAAEQVPAASSSLPSCSAPAPAATPGEVGDGDQPAFVAASFEEEGGKEDQPCSSVVVVEVAPDGIEENDQPGSSIAAATGEQSDSSSTSTVAASDAAVDEN